MDVIDIDSDLLRRDAEAALHAGIQSRVHVDGEIKDDIPELLETLVAEGPYAYSILAQVGPDGMVTVPIGTTRDDIHKAYLSVHEHSQLLQFWSLVELRGEWYVFHEGIVKVRDKTTEEISDGGETIALFPVTSRTGITGELVWSRVSPSALGARSNGSWPVGSAARTRRDLLLEHDQFLDALKTADIDGMLEVLNDDAQSAVRDYLNDTGTLVGLSGKEAHRSFYKSLFDKYEMCSVDLLRRVAQEWYVFAETRVTVRVRDGGHPGQTFAFHTAEFLVPANDGRFIVRIGHGTDPTPLDS
jgi:hypothetical protein